MGGHEQVPPEIAKTLVGWKKHFNSYTTQGRFNSVVLVLGLWASVGLYATLGRKKEAKK